MFVPPQSAHVEIQILNVIVLGGEVFGKQLGRENAALVNGTTALIKETPESSLPPSTTWGHSENMAICEPGSRSSSDNKSAGTLILDFSASRNVRNKYVAY